MRWEGRLFAFEQSRIQDKSRKRKSTQESSAEQRRARRMVLLAGPKPDGLYARS